MGMKRAVEKEREESGRESMRNGESGRGREGSPERGSMIRVQELPTQIVDLKASDRMLFLIYLGIVPI